MARRTFTTPDGIVDEGLQTGDGRIIAPGALTWELGANGAPLRFDQEDDGQHAGAVLVGAFTGFTRTATSRGAGANQIDATGWIGDDTAEGARAITLLDGEYPLGLSVDMDDMEVEILATETDDDDGGDVVLLAAALPSGTLRRWSDGSVTLHAAGVRAMVASAIGHQPPALVAAAGEGEPEDAVVLFTDAMDEIIMRVTRARIRGGTLVDIGAFAPARIVLDAADAAPADESPVDETPEAEPEAAASTGTASVADEVDAALAVQLDELANDPSLPNDVRAAAASALAALGCSECQETVTAPAVVAAAAPMRPPASWFPTTSPFSRGDVVEIEDPNTGRTLAGVPMRYEDTGQTFGHIALWGQCHTGSPEGQCVLTPRSASNYRWFRHGSLVLDDGSTVAVGNLTVGGGHADVMLQHRAAMEHYDNVATQAAQLVAGEDEWGVWVAGAGMPDLWDDELGMRRLRAASPSGDWRWIGGSLELLIAHAVNGPGLPVARAVVAAAGSAIAQPGTVIGLVAAGAREIATVTAAASRDGMPVTPAQLRDLVADAVREGFAAERALAGETEARATALAALRSEARTAARRRLARA